MNEVNRNRHYQNIEEERPLDLHELWFKFLRRRKLFFYIAIPIFIGILISQLTKPYKPIYRAHFDLGIVEEKTLEGLPSPYQEAPTSQLGKVTQRLISNLLSINLARKVIDTLSLYATIKYGNSDIKIDLNIKKHFEKQIGPLKIKFINGGFQILKNGILIKEGILNEYVDLDLFELKITPLAPIPQGKTYEITIFPKNKMALALRNSLSINVLDAAKMEQTGGASGVPFSGEGAAKKLVSGVSSNLGMIKISIYWGNPDDALRIARGLANLIIAEDKMEKSQQYVQSKEFIESQLKLYQEKLNEHAEKIRGFKKSKNIADLDASTKAVVSQISQIELRKSQLEIEEKILKNLNAYLSQKDIAQIDTTLHTAVNLLSDAVLQNLYMQFLQTEAELKGRLKEYSAVHPKVYEIKAKLDGIKEQMKEEIGKKLPTIKAEVSNVENRISNLLSKLENLSEEEIELATLERDRETAEKLYSFFVEKLEETRVQEAGVTSDLKIINPPVVSSTAVNSRGLLKGIILALIISILSGGFAVFIAEYLDNTVKDSDLLTDKIGLPVFASIPIVDSDERRNDRTGAVKKSGLIAQIKSTMTTLAQSNIPGIKLHRKRRHTERLKIINHDISSAEFEAFRKLSVNLDFAHPEKKYRIVYVTSPGPEEGKTFIALNLGIVLGITGKKVIVMDTDFRKKRGHLTDIIKSKKEEGIFDVLKGETNLRNAVIALKVPDEPSAPNALNELNALNANNDLNALNAPNAITIDLLPVGAIPPNPFIFLESERMKGLLDELKQNYEYIIIDGVPLLLFADAAYLATFADGVLLTAKYGKTNFKELEEAKDLVQSSQSNIIGIIMNGVPRERGSYHYHYYYKYYSKYYKKE